MSNPQDAERPDPQESRPEPAGPQPPAPQYGPPPHGAPQYGPPRYEPAGPQAPPGPQYGPPQDGAPDQFGAPQPPPQKSRKALWIVLGIVGGVLLLVGVGVAVLLNVVGGASHQARDLADDFNKLIIAGDTGTAYDKYLDPALMEKLTRDDFVAGVKGLELDGSCKPNYTDLKVSTNGTNGVDVAGSLDCDGKKVDLAYRFEGKDELRMVNIRLRPAA
ncbi:hypothetical protein [Arthrobacter sp. UYCu712]|uniref:hypothetical protein n=1 Tax=Arthrobacter sp. UYCu712 TaxID=3156340 RepID=UPI003395F4E0